MKNFFLSYRWVTILLFTVLISAGIVGISGEVYPSGLFGKKAQENGPVIANSGEE